MGCCDLLYLAIDTCDAVFLLNACRILFTVAFERLRYFCAGLHTGVELSVIMTDLRRPLHRLWLCLFARSRLSFHPYTLVIVSKVVVGSIGFATVRVGQVASECI